MEHQEIAAILKFSAHDLLADHSLTGSTTVSSPTITSSSETSTDPLLGVNGSDSDVIDDAILSIAKHHIIELERETAGTIEALLAYTKAGYALAKTKEGDRKFRILQLEETCDQLRRWRDEMEVNRSSLALQMRRDSKGDSEGSGEGGSVDKTGEENSVARRTTMGRLRALCSVRRRAKSNPVKAERDAIPKIWLEADRAGSQKEPVNLSKVKSQEYDADVSEANTHDSASERGEQETLVVQAKETEKNTTGSPAVAAEKVVRQDSPQDLRQEGEESAKTAVFHKKGVRTWTDAAEYRALEWSGSTDDEGHSPRFRQMPVENAVSREFEKKELDGTFSAPNDGSTTDNKPPSVYPEEIWDQQATPLQEIRQPSHTDSWPLVTATQSPSLQQNLIEEPKQHAALPFCNRTTDSGDQ